MALDDETQIGGGDTGNTGGDDNNNDGRPGPLNPPGGPLLPPTKEDPEDPGTGGNEPTPNP